MTNSSTTAPQQNVNSCPHEEEKPDQGLYAHLIALQKNLDEVKSALAEANFNAETSAKMYLEILSSRSWRITAPLRGLSNLWQLRTRFNKRISLIWTLPFDRGLKEFFLICKSLLRNTKSLFGHVGQDLDLQPKTMQENNASLDYDSWRRFYGRSEINRADVFRREILMLKQHPLISIVIPIYNTHPEILRNTFDSILSQYYERWEICVADDSSSLKETLLVLKEYEILLGSKLKIHRCKSRGHISQTTNSAIGLAKGKYIAFMDHDDLLSRDALFWVVNEINRNSEIVLIYSDEDKVSEDGRNYYDPHFKSDWNYELFLSQNYLSHLTVCRRDFIEKVGGFRTGFEGAQDWDFLLRLVEIIPHTGICHIPRILYHWRAVRGSTAVHLDEKSYALTAGKKAVAEHLVRKGESADVQLITELGYLRIKYSNPKNQPLVSIIIPTKNEFALLSKCVESIFEKTTYLNFEIVIIDNGSDDSRSLAYLKDLSARSQVRVFKKSESFNFSRLINFGANQCRGEFLLLLNNDTEVITQEWMSEMVSQAMKPGVGAVGAKLLFEDDTIQHGGVILVCGVAGHAHKFLDKRSPGYFGRAQLVQNFTAVTAACLLVQKKLFEEVDGFDESLAVAFNDVDFCLKLHTEGYRNIWTPFAQLYHYESKTRGYENSPEKRQRFLTETIKMKNKWGSLLDNDPFLNPNLSNKSESFLISKYPHLFY